VKKDGAWNWIEIVKTGALAGLKPSDIWDLGILGIQYTYHGLS